jgi:hypothetical protein
MSKKCFGRFEGTINCYERKKRRTGKPEFFKVYFHIKNHIRLMMKFEVTPHHLLKHSMEQRSTSNSDNSCPHYKLPPRDYGRAAGL